MASAAVVYHGWHLFTEKHRPLVRGLDDTYYYLWLPQVIISHDLDFGERLRTCPTISESDRAAELAVPLTSTGLHYNKFPIGWALGTLPFFLVARLVAVIFGAGDTGWEPVYQVAVWLGQATIGIAGLWAATKVLTRFFDPGIAARAVLIGWLASPLAYYQTAGLSLVHSQVFALTAFAIWLGLEIDDGRTDKRTFAALGFIAGLICVTRYSGVAYLLIPGASLICYFSRPGPQSEKIRRAVAFAAGLLPPLLVQMAAWRILYGNWIAYSYGDERPDWSHPHLIESLFSPRHGFFYWHPLMLAGVVGLFAWASKVKPARPWALSFIAILALNGCWPNWWFGASFGNRAYDGAIFLAMTGLAWIFSKTRSVPGIRRIIDGICGAAIIWNLLLLALFLTKRIPRETAVTWLDAWRAASGWFLS